MDMARSGAARARGLALLMLLCWTVVGHAAVVSSGASGFVLREEVEYPGAPALAWERLIRVGDWWQSRHTYSGDASRLSLRPEPGGCWCESLPSGGFVRHMDVIYVEPGVALRLAGGLGPLQQMGASGTLTFTLKGSPSGTTRVVVEYAVSVYSPEPLEKLATAVDRVLGEQMGHYATAPAAGGHPLEGGNP